MSYEPIAPGVDTDRLLRAIAAVESGGGRNNWPRVEVSYVPAGKAFTVQGRTLVGTGRNVTAAARPRWDRWGLSSAASWSPWQILYHTAADLGYAGPPWELFDPAVAEPYVVARLKKIAATGATTVRQFADAWNSGTWKDTLTPEEYMDAVEAHYNEV